MSEVPDHPDGSQGRPEDGAVPGYPARPPLPAPEVGRHPTPELGPRPTQEPPRWGERVPPAAWDAASGTSQPPQWNRPPQWGQQPQWNQPPRWGQQPYYGTASYGTAPYGAGPGYVLPPKPGVIPLRPLGLGEILDGAFQAARRNGKAMFGSSLLVQAAVAILSGLVLLASLGSGLDFLALSRGRMTEEQVMSLGLGMLGLFAGLFVVSLLSAMSSLVLQGVLVIPVARAVLNRHTGFGQMWKLARRRLGSLILLTLLYFAAILVAYVVIAVAAIALILWLGRDSVGPAILVGLVFLAAAVWVAIKLTIAPAALMLEDIGVFAAIRRSWQLTSRNWWRTFGITILAAIIVGVITQVVNTPVSFAVGAVSGLIAPHASASQQVSAMVLAAVISYVLSSLVAAVGYAFQSGVMALIYVDLRMRRDGLDVQLMRENESGIDDGGIPGRSPAVPGPGYPGDYRGGYRG